MQVRGVVLMAVALSLTPVLAFNGAISGERTQTSAVASDSGAFLVLDNLGPSAATPVQLLVGNDYEADLLRVTNKYSTTVVVQGTLTSNPGDRFKISNPSVTATIAPGAQHTFKIEDQDANHARICTSVTLRVDAFIGGTGGARQGHAIVSREVFVKVKPSC